MFLIFAFLAISLHTDFEGGGLNAIEQVAPDHFLCHVKGETDQDGRNRQASWYYFRVDGAKGKPITLDMVDLAGEYNYQPNRGAITNDTPPFFSDDQRTWRPIEGIEYDASIPRLRIHITPKSDRLWVAHVPPYTNVNLQRLLTEVRGNPYLTSSSAGRTPGGREIPLLTITGNASSDRNKKVIWLMFRQHAWEAGSSWSGEGTIRFLLSTDAAAAKIRSSTIVKIFPMCDPDGVARGGVRFNGHGYDLNRNWDTPPDAIKLPEITAQRAAIYQWLDSGHRIDLFLTLHNTETAEYLEGPPDTTGATRPLLERIFQLLSDTKTFSASRKPTFAEATTTIGKPGRMNAPQGLYHDRQIPAFLIEQRIAKHPKLGRQPNIEDRQVFGAELIQVLWKSLEL